MAGTSQRFHFTVTDFPDGAKSFVELPFQVDQDAERIEASYFVADKDGGPKSVIDLGMAHEGVSRGWTGSEYNQISISEDAASPGYIAGQLAGKWKLVLGIVHLTEGCKIDVTVDVIKKRRQWLSGDLHSHTEHSDGGVSVSEAVSRARHTGLDFVALTDHNTTAQNHVLLDKPGILVIPGMELTTYFGHTNFLGVRMPVKNWQCATPEQVEERMHEAKANGATIILNHFMDPGGFNRWVCGFQVPHDAVEIWNGHWSARNVSALQRWQEMLCEGVRIPATAGTDFHLKNKRRHGYPCNRLFADGRSVSGLLKAVREGRNVISAAPNGLICEPVSPDAPNFGDVIPVGSRIAIKFEGLSNADEIRIVTEKGVVEALRAENTVQQMETVLNGRFVRFEVWQVKDGDFAPKLFTNPIFAE
ncbi:CehA/McbA family metallohydrolase [uncultured Cohaesibacter sp.]|uniref:CehA/McbA family metallohydrolase n=1 Tax=uncultured Cohaesibacter sp. TaxID=1002546 RepID=UPI00292F99A6|nr:CehA/McbA family metallohydrolase [uncultured Cohaesibacter sp.]